MIPHYCYDIPYASACVRIIVAEVIVTKILDGLKGEMEKAYPAEGESEIRRDFGFKQWTSGNAASNAPVPTK